jgi:hypothetical protein
MTEADKRIAEIAAAATYDLHDRSVAELRDVENAIRAALADPLLNGREWLPIESAPKDGTTILAYGVHALEKEKMIATVGWSPYHHGFIVVPNEASEYDPEVSSATHWMPLPPAPKEK